MRTFLIHTMYRTQGGQAGFGRAFIKIEGKMTQEAILDLEQLLITQNDYISAVILGFFETED
jgi:hypothetical protein